jgi:exodeoxyribonuclease VII small subunit
VSKKASKDQIPFEQALAELESLVETMEKGDLSLEESLTAFERGIALTRHCQQALKEAEQKIEILTANSPDAELEPYHSD